jgi:hypothetical protein
MDLDVKQMEWIAKASSDGEGYIVIERGVDYRIGIAARDLPEGVKYSLEFLVRVVYPDKRIADALMERGYGLREEDGWLLAEKVVDPDLVSTEVRSLKECVERSGIG